MLLHKINYDQDPDITVSFEIDDDFRFLFCHVTGLIKEGSKGNNAADFLFGKLCQYFFQTDCYILILDFSNLQYSYGDRLRKSIDFFNHVGRDEYEKENPILLIEPQDPQGINSLLDWIQPKHLQKVTNIQEAKKVALDLFDKYINPL